MDYLEETQRKAGEMREPLLSRPYPRPFDDTVPDELRELQDSLYELTHEYWGCHNASCGNCTLNPDALYHVDTCKDAQTLDIIVRAYMLGFEHRKQDGDYQGTVNLVSLANFVLPGLRIIEAHLVDEPDQCSIEQALMRTDMLIGYLEKLYKELGIPKEE